MELLPLLPREQILLYLKEADLISCSAVSIGWRAAVNNNQTWKQACYRQSNKHTIDYIQTYTSSVLPAFKEPESYHNTLEPLCYWRVVYMKLQHLKRNWRLSNHETHTVTELAYNHFDLKIDNDLLLANVNDNECEVWNIRGVPQKQETIECALRNARCKCMSHIGDGRIVIVQDTLLQVYRRTSKSFHLQYRRLFNLPEERSKTVPGSLNVDEWYNDIVPKRPTHLQALNIGKYFIGVAQNQSCHNASFHLWDTVSGSKLKEESVKEMCPDVNDTVYNFRFCIPKVYSGKVLVCVQYARQSHMFGSYYTVFLIYDLPTLSFRKVKVLKHHVPWIYFENHLILTIDRGQSKLSIYKSSTGEKLATKQHEEIINTDSVQVHGDYLGYTTGGDLVILKVTDFNLVFTTDVIKFSSHLFGFDFTFLNWNLLLITRWDESNKIEVWSIEEKRHLSTLKSSGLMFPCSNSAQFFVWDEMVTTIYMLQFW